MSRKFFKRETLFFCCDRINVTQKMPPKPKHRYSREEIRNLYENLDPDVLDYARTFSLPILSIRNEFKNCGEYIRAMKIRQSRNPDRNDILASVSELRIVVNNTLVRMWELLKPTKFIKFGEVTDEMRADNVFLRTDTNNSYIINRLWHATYRIHDTNISLDQLIRVCEWITKIKKEIKVIWLRVKDTLEYLEEILLRVRANHDGKSVRKAIMKLVEIDENRYLYNVRIHMNHNMNPIHKALTFTPSKLREMLGLWKYQFAKDTEQVARLMGKIESRRGRWEEDDTQTDLTRRNAASALLSL